MVDLVHGERRLGTPIVTADEKAVALGEELTCAVALVSSGLASYRALTLEGDDYYTPLFLLSNGFERLLKVGICLAVLEQEGSYPTDKGWKKEGCVRHSPRALLDNLRGRVRAPSSGVSFVFDRSTDGHTPLGRMVGVLDEHAEAWQGRYFMLDVVLGNKALFGSTPLDEWRQAEVDHMLEAGLLHATPDDGEELRAAHAVTVKAVADELGWLAWAIAMLFMQGALGRKGRQMSALVHPFLAFDPPLELVRGDA